MVGERRFKSGRDLAKYALSNQKDGQDPIESAKLHISGDVYKAVVGPNIQAEALEILSQMEKSKDDSE